VKKVRKILLTIGSVFVLCLITSVAFAAFPTTPTSVGVSASIDSVEEFNLTLYQGDSAGKINWSSTPASMTFGKLEPVDPTKGYNSLSSKVFYAVACGIRSNTAKAYTVKYEGSDLTHTDGITKVSNDCWTLTLSRMVDSDGVTILSAPGTFNLTLDKAYYASRALTTLYQDGSGRGASFIEAGDA